MVPYWRCTDCGEIFYQQRIMKVSESMVQPKKP
jgi:formylmethanofuran dehydrogenase subunit E